MAESEGNRRSTGRRQSKNASARKKALDQLRKYRKTGEKVSYEVESNKEIYDVVDEDAYAQIVQDRQNDDFIVDDDDGNYYDDGREIFDDDPIEKPSMNGKEGKSKREKKGSNIQSNNIANMFTTSNIKKKGKESTVTIEGDELLQGILTSISSNSKPKLKQPKLFSKTPERMAKHPPRRLQITQKAKSNGMETGGRKNNKFDICAPNIDGGEEGNLESEFSDGIEIKEEENHHLSDSDLIFDDGIEIDNILKNEELIEGDIGTSADLHKNISGSAQADILEETIESEVNDTNWDQLFCNDAQEALPDIDTSVLSSLPLTKVDGEEVFRFFWLDAYEDRYNQPGTVFLFGKTWIEENRCYASCCVAVRNINRQVYFLPRKTRFHNGVTDTGQSVEFKDVYEELDNNLASKYNIMEYKCRKVEKKYAFEIADVPHEHDYLEVLYSAKQNPLPNDLKGETFSHVFGTNTSSLELLFLNQNIHGPSWIDIKFPVFPHKSLSWCRLEVDVDRPSFLKVIESEPSPPPPLTVLSLSLIALSQPKKHSHEIISLSGLVHQNIYLDKGEPHQVFDSSFCFVTNPADQLLPFDFKKVVQKKRTNIQILPNERAMLGLLLAKIQTIDPDVIVGHDMHDFYFNVLLHRLSANKVANWSKIGRLKRANFPKFVSSSKQSSFSVTEKDTACGRLVCDIKISCKELMRCKSYDLTELTSVVLKKERMELSSQEVQDKLLKSDMLLAMIQNNRMDAFYNLQIMYELNVLPLAYQITVLCGNVMSRTLLGGRSERNEYLLLHAFNKRGYLVPDKSYGNKKKTIQSEDTDINNEHLDSNNKKGKGRKKPAYTGGLVLEPKKGFYDKYILLLDFNSLYPSIIQEYNICFTTTSRGENTSNSEGVDVLPDIPSAELDPGVLPTEIKRLVERRKQVKQLLKTTNSGTDLYMQYDIRQKALKLTANSMYGCLGFSHSRFYAKPLAALVTGKGREILMKTKDVASNLGLDVIYGDTDSIMINTNSQDLSEVKQIGNKVKTAVNKLYRLVELDIDGIFKSMLLLKKKKYAAITVDVKKDGTLVEKMEIKGLDIVRRDWCELAQDAGKFVLNEILSSKPHDTIIENIHDYLRSVHDKLEASDISTEKFEINKTLTKNPDEYPNKKTLPHVTVALRLRAQGRHVAIGDTISYIICKDGTNLPASQRAYYADEISKNSNLKIDNFYYLASQLHPVVSRLCDPVEGADSVFIATCLGLDPSSYESKVNQQDCNEESISALMSDEERFKDVDKIYIRCLNNGCKSEKKEVEFKGSFENEINPFKCQECSRYFDENGISNSLQLFVREIISKYYKCWLSCDDKTCGNISRHVSVKNVKYQSRCPQCRKGYLNVEYSDAALYNQIYYMSQLFDVSKWGETLKSCSKDFLLDSSTSEKMQNMQNAVKKILEYNGYSTVNIGALFK